MLILAMFAIPCLETEPIEDVLFIEPQIENINDAIELVKRYNDEGMPWMRQNNTKTKRQPSLISDNRDQPNQWIDTHQQSTRVSNLNVQISNTVVRLSATGASSAANSPIVPMGKSKVFLTNPCFSEIHNCHD